MSLPPRITISHHPVRRTIVRVARDTAAGLLDAMDPPSPRAPLPPAAPVTWPPLACAALGVVLALVGAAVLVAYSLRGVLL